MLAVYIVKDCVAYCFKPAQGQAAGRPANTDVPGRPRKRYVAIHMKTLGQSKEAADGRQASLSTTSGYGSCQSK